MTPASSTPRILLIRLTSLGDVVHNITVVHDIKQHYPSAQIDWLVDSSCAAALHYVADIHRVVALPLRRWRTMLKTAKWQNMITVWHEFCATRKLLNNTSYDYAIDLQGLFKSAFFLRGLHVKAGQKIGMANRTKDSSYEAIAKFFYQQKITMPWEVTAIERARLLVAQALQLVLEPLPRCVFKSIPRPPTTEYHPQRYGVLLLGTSRSSKQWHDHGWHTVIEYLCRRDFLIFFPHANDQEKNNIYSLLKNLSATMQTRCIILPLQTIDKLTAWLAHADIVVGLDSGLSHLACALQRPNVQIYCGDAHAWRTAWLNQPHSIAVYEADHSKPSSDKVINGLNTLISHSTISNLP